MFKYLFALPIYGYRLDSVFIRVALVWVQKLAEVRFTPCEPVTWSVAHPVFIITRKFDVLSAQIRIIFFEQKLPQPKETKIVVSKAFQYLNKNKGGYLATLKEYNMLHQTMCKKLGNKTKTYRSTRCCIQNLAKTSE